MNTLFKKTSSRLNIFIAITTLIGSITYSFADQKPSDEEIKKFSVELLNYQESNTQQYAINENPQFDINRKNLELALQLLYAKDVSNKNFDMRYMQLLIQNCPRELIILIKKLAKGSRHLLPSKILLAGPSGSGKSSLAQIIGQLGRPTVYMVDGASFANEYQHSGIQNLMRLFEPLLATSEPVAIIIDELTALTNRTSPVGNKGCDSGMVQKFWCLLDKCDEKKNILIIATANDLEALPMPIKTRFSAHTYYIDNPGYSLRKEIIRYYFPNYDELYFWQKVALLNKTSNLSIRELKSIIENASTYKEFDEQETNYSDLLVALSHHTKAQSKFVLSLKNKFYENAHWLLPFLTGTIINLFSILRHESFQRQLVQQNQHFQEKMQEKIHEIRFPVQKSSTSWFKK